MHHFLKTYVYMLLAIVLTVLQLACSKDSDLLADQMLPSGEATIIEGVFTKEDFSTTTPGQSVVIDVLGNDEFPDPDGVKIIEVSQPKNGTITINADRTLTYSPTAPAADAEAPTESITDNFEYTTEGGTTEENEVVQETAPITVTITPPAPIQGENVYYVTVNGSKSNNGKSEAAAWSIEHAFGNARAGNIVYIKAGNYGHVELKVHHSGSSNNPVQFIGYSKTPGDVVSNNGSTFKYGDKIDASKMPLLKSNTAGEKGIGLHVHKDYIEIQNFQIQLYEKGIDANGESQLFKNIITYQTGPQHIDKPSGQAIVLRGNNSTLENCFDYNAVSQGITLNGASNALVKYCQVYNDNEINPGGYYILLSTGTKNSVVENCTIYRKVGLSHGGHGFVMKDVAQGNIVRNSIAYNTGIETNFSGVHDNLFENIEIYGVWPKEDVGSHSSSIKVANGSHHNTFKNIHLEDVLRGFGFEDWKDGNPGSGGDMPQGGNNNVFENITVKNASKIIYMAGGTSSSTFSNNNVWNNCTFINIDKAFYLGSKNNNNVIKNSKFDSINLWETSDFGFNFSFENCTFSNTGFSTLNILNN